MAHAVPALADERPTYALNWSRGQGARECATGAMLAKQVEAKLGRAVFVSPSSAELSIEGRIDRTEPGWSANIAVYDRDGNAHGQRDLSSAEKDCRALDRAITLMLALTVDPRAAIHDDEASEPPAPPVAASPTPPAAPPSNPGPSPPIENDHSASPAPPTGDRPRAHVEAGSRLAFGLLPTTAVPGFVAAATLPLGRQLGARVGATAWPPSRASAGEAGAFFSLFTATFAVCQRNETTNAQILFCTGLEPGLLAEAGYGFTARTRAEVTPVLMLTTGARGAIRLTGPLWAQIGGDVVVPLVRNQFYYLQSSGNESDVFLMPIVGGTLDASLLLTFP